MPKKIVLKTKENTKSVAAFLDSIDDPIMRKDAKKLLTMMKRITKKQPRMWGDSIIGFGSYEYKRSNGDYGEFLATGFSPRKSALTIYIMAGYKDYSALMKKLGSHKSGSSCLYLKSLEKIDLSVLETLIKTGLKDLKKTHKVT